jgi:hypothetical protein
MRARNIRRYTVAGLAVAAMAGSGLAVAATAADAATATPATLMAYHTPAQWELRGVNDVSLTFEGNTYTYVAHFRTQVIRTRYGSVELLTGSLTDTYEPVTLTLPLQGTISGNHVVFSVRYPTRGVDAGNQGVRTFSGTINRHGDVSGVWFESGSEHGSGPFSLAVPATR